MDLTRKQVETLLNVTPDDLDNFIQNKNLPCYTLGQERRFDLLEIEAWLLSHHFWQDCSKALPYNLYRALAHGGFEVMGDVEDASILGIGAKWLASKIGIDEEGLYALLKEREQLASTAIGSGFAIPHPRERIEGLHHDVLYVLHLLKPVEFNALDHNNVHTFFFLISGSDKSHLNLLSKIAHFIHDESANHLIHKGQTYRTLLQAFLEWEKSLSNSTI